MAYKDILIHLDNSPRSETRLDVALDWAGRHKSFLTGLYPFEVPSPSLYMGDASVFDLALADEIMTRARQAANEVSETIGRRFGEKLRKSAVAGEYVHVDASPAQAVTSFSSYSDLVIVGQMDPDRAAPLTGVNIPVTAMLQSGRPVLVIPYVGDVQSVGQRVLIGWKLGREAARAVNDAMPLLKAARGVTVLTIDSEDNGDDARQSAKELVRHLGRHGIDAKAEHTVSAGVPDGDVLLNSASDLGADLLVVGGYGHSRASEFILGGVTRTLLTEMTVPVLFSH